MSVLHQFPHSLADYNGSSVPSDDTTSCYRVVVTCPHGNLLEETPLYHLHFARRHYRLSIRARKYRPSLIVLFDPSGEPAESCYIDQEGNVLD